MNRPLPDVSAPEFAPFWSGTEAGEIRLPFCPACGQPHWPPRPICPHCRNMAFVWRPVSGKGTVYTWTVVEHQTTPGIRPPYVVALVELAGYPSVRLLGQLTGVAPHRLCIGMPVIATFDRMREGVTLVNWTTEPEPAEGH